MIEYGRGAPFFVAPNPTNSRFHFSSLGGRWLLLAFLPSDATRAAEMSACVEQLAHLFRRDRLLLLLITRDEAVFAQARDEDGKLWFHDTGGIAEGYGALGKGGAEPGRWVLVDPSMRVADWFDGAAGDARMMGRIQVLPEPDAHAGVPVNAPVLILPRIFEPDLCRKLIGIYDRDGGAISGTMQQIDGRTVPVVSAFKRRRDAQVLDEALRADLRGRIERRLLPQIYKAFQFNASRIERYIVARYDAEEGGWFRPHRDNTTTGTAHRKFACSINLNAEDFEGGDLRFPEFGSRTYRPPTGGAVVFSCSLLHEATPVTRGTRYAFLPFFFDEAGETLRQANLHTLDQAQAQPAA